MRHSHCLCLLSGHLNKAKCFERQAAGCVKLKPGRCLLSSLTSVQSRKQGRQTIGCWTGGSAGRQQVEMSPWMMSPPGKSDSKAFCRLWTWGPYCIPNQTLCWLSTRASVRHLLRRYVIEIILPYKKEDMDSIFNSALIYSVALEKSLSSRFIPLQKRVRLSTPKYRSPDNCGIGSVWRKWQPTPAFLPGESHGQRSLAGYSPRGHRESDTTERLHFSFTSVEIKTSQWGRHKAFFPFTNVEIVV